MGWELKELLEVGRLLRADASVGVVLAESLLRVRGRDGVSVAFRANAVQREYERTRGRANVVLKARQMGMSTWVAGQFFLRTITARGVLTVQVAHTREAAESLFAMVRRFWENLPVEMREGPLKLSRANAGQMVFAELDSEFRVVSAGDENAGRGFTVQNLHCSEVSRWSGDAAATLAGLRAALVPGGEMVLESTPNGAYGCFYDEWVRAGESGMVRHFFPWWMEESYVGAAVDESEWTAEERALGLTCAQVGFRRGVAAGYRGLAVQEFAEDAERCFRASGDCVFDLESVERRLMEAPEVVGRGRGGALLTWLPAMAGKKYLVSVDTAGGGSAGDYACVQVVELQSGLQCAELQERIGPRELVAVCCELAMQYNDALVVVERNNHGAAVLAHLEVLRGRRGASRGEEGVRWQVYEQGGQEGWLTTSLTRAAMISRLDSLLVESSWMFASKRLLGECRTFVLGANGRSGAASGAHDDCVMAMAMAHCVRDELLGRGWVGHGYWQMPVADECVRYGRD